MAKTTLEQWDETAANNSDTNSINIAENCAAANINNAIRENMAQTAAWLGDDTLASGTTTDLGSVPGRYVTVSGTTTITGLGTIKAGTIKYVTFSGALTLTHNATSLILPGGANITTAAGDAAVFVSEGSGNWRCVSYSLATGRAVVRTGDWITLSTHTISNQAAVSITGIPSGARVVKIYMTNLSPVTDNQALLLRTSTNGGSSYDSGASDYWYTHLRSVTGGATSNLGGQSSAIYLSGNVGNASGELLVGTITLMNPGLGQPCMLNYETDHVDGTGSTYYAVRGGGARRASTDVDALQLTFASGNLNTGNVTVEYKL